MNKFKLINININIIIFLKILGYKTKNSFYGTFYIRQQYKKIANRLFTCRMFWLKWQCETFQVYCCIPGNNVHLVAVKYFINKT